jgi:hypothetical protein
VNLYVEHLEGEEIVVDTIVVDDSITMDEATQELAMILFPQSFKVRVA